MKNILIVDSAANCAYDVFEVSDDNFVRIFCGEGQDIEFIEDLSSRADWKEISLIVEGMWKSPVRKAKAEGIHGTIFYGLPGKKKFYPNKRDADLDMTGRAFSSKSL